jgi:hypothetical protein
VPVLVLVVRRWVGSCFFWDFSLSEFPPAEAQEKMSLTLDEGYPFSLGKKKVIKFH